jgi:prevent-host-death family protein
MGEIGSFEAKNKFSALLDQVEHGMEIVITRHGKAVAKLVPVEAGFDRKKAKRASRRSARSEQGIYAPRSENQGPCQRRAAVSFVVDNSVALAWCFEDEHTQPFVMAQESSPYVVQMLRAAIRNWSRNHACAGSVVSRECHAMK